MSFLLGELPYIKGKVELALEGERQTEVDKTIESSKESLSILRDDLYEKIAKKVAGAYKEYTDSLKSVAHCAIPNKKVKNIHEEIKDILSKERVSLIFQEAFNESAGFLEEFVFGAVQSITKQKAEVYFTCVECRVVRELGEIDKAIGELDIPEHSKGIRKRIQTLSNQLSLKFQY
eukprot:TRINITY_DN3333_c0_g1_i1.p1 TRINITY_DN3333_c0_g1~~TRINITY_DN3333_c0_g1_i1.p1  ORF type:complete len:176 (-),score=39.59 TRINITY_DN3333_c0_g1_i1:130-657(-)